ncbi:MAG: DUF1844 domain-containing protein [Acidobacteriota bacterium]
MTDEKESSFKVTDRRKFHADGSPRDQAVEAEPAAIAKEAATPQPIPVESSVAAAESAPNNVVSFPAGEPSRRREQAQSPLASPSSAVASSAPAEARQPAAAAARDEQGAAEKAFNTAAGPRADGVPEASFLNLLNMLAVEAAMHLGMIHPQGQEPLPVDPESARHLIDLLGMLQAKTRGNLTAEEDSLLENILADLRMQFVAVSKA